jgi:hyaluronan synthase
MSSGTITKNQVAISPLASLGLQSVKYDKKILATTVFYFLIFAVLIIKALSIQWISGGIIFFLYSFFVAFYVISRFALSYFYTPAETEFDPNYEPTVSFAVPSKNEGEHIKETIMRMAYCNYPKNKFDIIAVNDGSTDNTLEEMLEAEKMAKRIGVTVKVIDWKVNQGKREGMAECVRQSDKDIILFVDSDSFIEEDALKAIVKYFSLPKIGAVAGQALVANAQTNFLTRMQSVRYYVAFKAYKSAEALFGSVTCCSGCLAAYRREVVLPMLPEWTNQYFLGVRCTYGDDRSLTNRILREGYDTVFAPDSIAHTFVPDNFRVYVKQQLRWKKSWLRESFMACAFMWRKNILMSISFYLGFILPIAGPFIVLRTLVWHPIMTGALPVYYFTGLFLMTLIYGLYYYRYTGDKNWLMGVISTSFYSFILIWQLPYALFKIRDTQWGTR